MAAAVRAVEAEHGAVGALVNNAGYSQSGAVETVPIDEVRRQFETNVFGLARMCQLVLPAMRAQALGADRQRLLDGRQAHLPGRRLLPRDQVRGGGDQRRAALRGQGLRRPRRRSSSRGSSAPTSARRRPRRSAQAEAEGPYGGLQRGGGAGRRRTSTSRAPPPASAAGPRRRQGDREGDHREPPKIRYRVTPGARVLIGQRALMTDRMWDRFVGTQFPRPGAQ